MDKNLENWINDFHSIGDDDGSPEEAISGMDLNQAEWWMGDNWDYSINGEYEELIEKDVDTGVAPIVLIALGVAVTLSFILFAGWIIFGG